MSKKILITAFLLGLLPSKAVFTNFSNPDKKIVEIKNLHKTPVKKIIKKKNHKIQSAILWKLLNRKFLGKKLNSEEELLIDSEALDRFIEAASLKNPQAYKIYRSNSKNSELMRNFARILSSRTNINTLENYIDAKNHKEQEQKKLVINEVKNIQKLYQKLKETYREGKPVSEVDYQNLKSQITACCGLENFLYVEGLLKREINFEIFNS